MGICEPLTLKNIGGNFKMNMVYRAYRTPYEWVPQATHAEEVSIEPLDVETFRVPGASKGAGTGKVTVVAGWIRTDPV